MYIFITYTYVFSKPCSSNILFCKKKILKKKQFHYHFKSTDDSKILKTFLVNSSYLHSSYFIWFKIICLPAKEVHFIQSQITPSFKDFWLTNEFLDRRMDTDEVIFPALSV